MDEEGYFMLTEEEQRRGKPMPLTKASEKMLTMFCNVCIFCCLVVVVAVTLKMILNLFF